MRLPPGDFSFDRFAVLEPLPINAVLCRNRAFGHILADVLAQNFTNDCSLREMAAPRRDCGYSNRKADWRDDTPADYGLKLS